MDVLLSDTASFLFAIGLTIPVASATLDFNTRPAWSRAITFLALVVVLIGYAASLFLSLHFQDHRAYLVAYTASTIGACWLVIATIVNLRRLICHLETAEDTTIRLFRLSWEWVFAFIGLLQMAALACFIVGSMHLAVVHSENRIQGLADVLARVESEERSKSFMFAGQVLETVVLTSFLTALLGLWRYIPCASTFFGIEQSQSAHMSSRSRRTFYAMSATILSILIRTVFHLAEFFMTEPEGLEMAATSTIGFYLDLAPVFCACWTLLAQSSALNAADEVSEARQSGWPGNEKQRSAC